VGRVVMGRCPVFKPWQLASMFSLISDTREMVREYGMPLCGSLENPQLPETHRYQASPISQGWWNSVEIKTGECNPYQLLGTFHTHPHRDEEWYEPPETYVPDKDPMELKFSLNDYAVAMRDWSKLTCIGGYEGDNQPKIRCRVTPEGLLGWTDRTERAWSLKRMAERADDAWWASRRGSGKEWDEKLRTEKQAREYYEENYPIICDYSLEDISAR